MNGKRMENRAARENMKEAVLLVDDHELIRLGFRALLEMQDGTHPGLVVFEADTLEGGMQVYADHRDQIAVVVLDLALPDAEGLGGLMAFRQRFPEAAIVVLSGVQSGAVMQHALALGALAYFPKSGDLADMTHFVQRCARQDLRLPRVEADAMAALAAEGFDLTRPAANNPRLNHRQLEILQWLLEGKSNREISQLSSLSEGTIKNNVSMLLLAFDVRSRSQLISKLRP